MKTANKLKPILLDYPDAPQGYQVRVEFSNVRWAYLNFSEKIWAQMELNRIRAQGIYCDSWIVTGEGGETHHPPLNATLEQL